MQIKKIDNQIIITLDKGPDNLIYKWLEFNANKKLTEAMHKSAQFDQLAESLKLIVGASQALAPQPVVEAQGEEIKEKPSLTEEEIIKKITMF